MKNPKTLVWVGSICRHVEAVQEDDEYKLGDSEPCVWCGNLWCEAEVRRAADSTRLGQEP